MITNELICNKNYVDFLAIAIITAPIVINATPNINCQLIFSLRNIMAKISANTNERLVMGATDAASPSFNALNESKEETAVIMPAAIK